MIIQVHPPKSIRPYNPKTEVSLFAGADGVLVCRVETQIEYDRKIYALHRDLPTDTAMSLTEFLAKIGESLDFLAKELLLFLDRESA